MGLSMSGLGPKAGVKEPSKGTNEWTKKPGKQKRERKFRPGKELDRRVETRIANSRFTPAAGCSHLRSAVPQRQGLYPGP